MRPVTRKEAYGADITYGTNNEFGFDYLRDNMVVSIEQCVQRDLVYAIVDEVDNILIDEARTPLIISGQAGALDRPVLPVRADREATAADASITTSISNIRRVDADRRGHRQASRSSPGFPKARASYDERYIELTHYLEQALKARGRLPPRQGLHRSRRRGHHRR